MPDVHVYLPDELYSYWKNKFSDKGMASQWIQKKLIEEKENEISSKTWDELRKQKEQLIEKTQKEIDEITDNEYESRKNGDKEAEDEKRTKEELIGINPLQLKVLTKSIISNYGFPESRARELAIKYLQIRLEGMLDLDDFIRELSD